MDLGNFPENIERIKVNESGIDLVSGVTIEINNIRKRRYVRAKKLRDNSKDMEKYQGSRVYQHFEENKKQWKRQKKR